MIVGFLPHNDLTDNDRDWWRDNAFPVTHYRYRPYAVLAADRSSYGIVHGVHGDATPRDDFDTPPAVPSPAGALATGRQVLAALSEVSASFHLLRQLLIQRWSRGQAEGYFSTNEDALLATRLVFADLGRAVGNRQKVILLLAHDSDLAEQRRRGATYSDEFSRLLQALRLDGWLIIDTAEAVATAGRTGDVTLGCDSHWNASTNRMVAEFLLTNYRDLLIGTPAD